MYRNKSSLQNPHYFYFYCVLGIVTTFFISRFLPSIPYTVVIFLIGTLFSVPTDGEDPTVYNSLTMWYSIDPELILFIFLPALLFGESMSLKIHEVRSTIGASCILAGSGNYPPCVTISYILYQITFSRPRRTFWSTRNGCSGEILFTV